jgi:hypothetical protein
LQPASPAAETEPAPIVVSEDFDGGSAGQFQSKSGLWRVDGSKYVATQQHVGQNLLTLVSLDRALPERADVRVTFNADPTTSTRWSNAFIVFDYQSPTDYKFAGALVGVDQWVIGRMTSRGYAIDKSVRATIQSGKDYELQVLLDGSKATLKAGASEISHTYSGALQRGQLGLATLRGNARFDGFSAREFRDS